MLTNCRMWTTLPTGSEIISLYAGLRMDGIPALGLWDLVIEVFHSSSNQIKEIQWKSTRKLVARCSTFFEDNEVVILMIIKGRSPTITPVSRTHRVALDWLFDRINLDPRSKSSMLTPKTNSQTY